MIDTGEGGCCRCLSSFIITSGFTALFLWLSLRVSNPTCSIEQFDVFALYKTPNSTNNHTIHYDLKLNNKNKDKGIYYDTLNLTFYYKPSFSYFALGNVSCSGLYQGHGMYTNRVGDMKPGGVNWEMDAIATEAKSRTAVFRVELATAVRFKIIFWKTKRHHLVVGSDLLVNDQGSLVKGKKNKGIRLSSRAVKIKGCFKLLITLSALFFVHFYF